MTLLDASGRPIYALNAGRCIAYCNPALAAWLGLEASRIVGRSVEYHSEPATEMDARPGSAALTDLCPPPQALAGTPSSGTVGCVDRSGRLVHRRADFLPLAAAGQSACGLLAILASADMSPQELAAELSDEPTPDELHRAIRRFRRDQATEYGIESLLGESVGMRKVRAQVAAAAASQANVLVRGRRGTGREHIARAIHYRAPDGAGKLVPIDCELATEESLRRNFESARSPREAKERCTVLLLGLERLAPPLQSQILPIAAHPPSGMRFVVTMAAAVRDDNVDGTAPAIQPYLLGALSTITIDVPSLAERLVDLPLLAQCFLEAANRGSAKQVGSLRPDALDQLALYRWPAELDELRSVVTAAHAAASTAEITPADLPPVIHHATKAASLPRREPERIVLDDFLAGIEREVITRALAQARGNKSAAAELLGMNRPRLYRRLVQLGLVKEAAEDIES